MDLLIHVGRELGLNAGHTAKEDRDERDADF
jgi:hypothetical protein